MSTPHNSPSEPQSIEELRKRYERLNAQRQKAETDLRVAEERLKDAQVAAREAYGTEDLDELKAKLDQWTEENLRRRLEYQESLNRIEAELARIRAESEEGE